MNVLILNGGKEFLSSGGKLSSELCKCAKEVLESIGQTCEITNIDAGYDADKEVEKILKADVLIWQFPGWWMGEPWIVKRYIDIVFSQGMGKFISGDGRHSADPEHNYGTGGLLKNKKYMLSTTWNAPQTAFIDKNEFFEGRGIDGVLFNFHKSQQFLGLKPLPSFMCNDVIKNPQFEHYISEYKKHLQSIFK